MIENRYNYKIRFDIPEIEYTNEQVISFLVIKMPIKKFAPLFVANIIMNSKDYDKLVKTFKPNKPLDCFLTISVLENKIDCDLVQTLKERIKYNLVEKYPLKIIKVKLLDKQNYFNDSDIRFALVQLMFENTNIYQMQNDYSMINVYHNCKIQTIYNEFVNKIKSNYNFNIYDIIKLNDTIFKQVIIKMDTSILEVPYELQKYYKLSNGAPIYFFDTFSSYNIFDDYYVYKSFDLLDLHRAKKHSYVGKVLNTVVLKEEKIDKNELVKIISRNPNEVVLIDKDASYDVVKFDNTYSEIIDKLANEKRMNFSQIKKDVKNELRYVLHVPDNKKNTIERFLNLKKLCNKIENISRMRFMDVSPLEFDIGVLYQFNSYDTYRYIFLNMIYYFQRSSSGNILCNVIGDLIRFAD